MQVPLSTLPEAQQPSQKAIQDAELRGLIFETLRRAEQEAVCPECFRAEIRWPVVEAMLANSARHQVRLAHGLVIEIGLDSRIEKALLLSAQEEPDHVWEPQTTKLLLTLAKNAAHVIVGGAYIGDQVLFLAQALAMQEQPGTVHAFEPMSSSHACLRRNVQLNALTNVVVRHCGLWDSNTTLQLMGQPALASTVPIAGRDEAGEIVPAVTIASYVASQGLGHVGLIMLDIEGGEEPALVGAQELLQRPWPEAPHVVFEVHRQYVDWSTGLAEVSIVRRLTALGYQVWAI